MNRRDFLSRLILGAIGLVPALVGGQLVWIRPSRAATESTGHPNNLNWTLANTTYPFSFSCWANADVAAATSTALCWADTGNNQYWRLQQGSGSWEDDLRGSSAVDTITLGTVTADTWVHLGHVSAASNDHKAYQDGTEYTNTTDLGTVDVDEMCTCYNQFFARDNEFDGRLAEIAAWPNVEISAAEMTAMSKGASPALVHPEGLEFYAPFIRDITMDYTGGTTISEEGTMTVYNHPPAIYASQASLQFPGGAGAPAGIVTPRKFWMLNQP